MAALAKNGIHENAISYPHHMMLPEENVITKISPKC